MASRMIRVSAFSACAVIACFGSAASVLAGCDEPPKSKPADKQPSKAPPKDKPPEKASEATPERETVTINGNEFKLDLAVDEQTRFRGLSGRTHIASDGGMLFAFPFPRNSYFVMRDCPIPIDIIFLDATGRVTAMHKMQPESPRGPDEKELNEDGINGKYEARLVRYPSRYDSQFVIELAGDTLDSLKLKEGDQIKLDLAGLKKRAK